jgi:hypothetical protein
LLLKIKLYSSWNVSCRTVYACGVRSLVDASIGIGVSVVSSEEIERPEPGIRFISSLAFLQAA